jgi:hypothetical protein
MVTCKGSKADGGERKERVEEIIQCVALPPTIIPTITFVMDFVDAIVPWQRQYKLYYL